MDNLSLQGLTNKVAVGQNVTRSAGSPMPNLNTAQSPSPNNPSQLNTQQLESSATNQLQSAQRRAQTNNLTTSGNALNITNESSFFLNNQQVTANLNFSTMLANISQNTAWNNFLQTMLPGLIRPSTTLQDDKLQLFSKEGENRKFVLDPEHTDKKVEHAGNEGSESSRDKVAVRRKFEGITLKNILTRIDVLIYRTFHNPMKQIDVGINSLFYKLPIFSRLKLSEKIAFSRASLIFEKAIIAFSVILSLLIVLAMTHGFMSLLPFEVNVFLQILLMILVISFASFIGYILGITLTKAINLLRTLIIFHEPDV